MSGERGTVTVQEVLDAVPLTPLDGGDLGAVIALYRDRPPIPAGTRPGNVDVSALVCPPTVVAFTAIHYAASVSGRTVEEVVFDLRCALSSERA